MGERWNGDGSRVRRWLPRAAALGAALVALSVALSGCSPTPDPEATRDSLVEATQSPAPDERDEVAEALAQYDATTHPESIAEPLECSRYLVITARGTGERPSGQLLSTVARLISEARPGEVEIVDLDYPADGDVKLGATRGVRLLIDIVNQQSVLCAEQRFILLGYSQGALIIGDALTAPEYRIVGTVAGTLISAAKARIAAVVFYGDPRFLGSEAFGVGSFDPALNGLLPRPPGSLEAVADRLRSYCEADDIVCQSTLALEGSGHVVYYSNGMQQDGAAFVITRLDPPAPPEDGADESKEQAPVRDDAPEESERSEQTD